MSDWLQRVRELEPARVRAVWTAVDVGVDGDTDGEE